MQYRVIKHAFNRTFVADVEKIAATFPMEPGAVLEKTEYSTRDCELRWIRHGSPGYALLEKIFFGVLAHEKLLDPKLCVLEDLQHTVYGPGAFHDWHVDSYKRSYNQFDSRGDKRFIGRKRKVSMSVLLNDASEFEGGAFEISMFPNGRNTVGTALTEFSEAGDLAIFDSNLCHRVAPVTGGVRRSLVAWICA
ncbi:MAG: Synechococcus phage [Pseudomonadota bacterium]